MSPTVQIGNILFHYRKDTLQKIENSQGDVRVQIQQYLPIHFIYGKWNLEKKFIKDIEEILRAIVALEKKTRDPIKAADAADHLFNSFTPFWLENLQNAKHIQAKQLWIEIIELTKKVERNRNRHIHKGTPYYFLATTYLDELDTEVAINFLHEGVEEDKGLQKRSRGKRKAVDAPGFKTISLNKGLKNFLAPNVNYIRNNILEKYLRYYNRIIGDSLQLSTLDKVFLQNEKYQEETFVLAHFLYWTFRWSRLSKYLSVNNSFANFSMMRMQSLLAGIIEQLLRHAYGKRTFGKNYYALYAEEQAISTNQAKEEMDAFVEYLGWNRNIDKALIASLDWKPSKNSPIKDRRYVALLIALQFRNHCAHQLSATRSIADNSERITIILFIALFIVIRKLQSKLPGII